jgi:hypothetical protein
MVCSSSFSVFLGSVVLGLFRSPVVGREMALLPRAERSPHPARAAGNLVRAEQRVQAVPAAAVEHQAVAACPASAAPVRRAARPWVAPPQRVARPRLAAPPGREAPARAVPQGQAEAPGELRRAVARGQAAVVATLGAAQERHPVVRLAAAERRTPAEPNPLVLA